MHTSQCFLKERIIDLLYLVNPTAHSCQDLTEFQGSCGFHLQGSYGSGADKI